MYFSDATLTFPQTLVLRYSQLEPEERRNPQVATDYAKWFLGRLRAVEAATANAETLVAGRFTAADIVIGYALRLAENIGLAKDFGPNVAAYWQRLQRATATSTPSRRKNSPANSRRWLRRSCVNSSTVIPGHAPARTGEVVQFPLREPVRDTGFDHLRSRPPRKGESKSGLDASHRPEIIAYRRLRIQRSVERRGRKSGN